MTEQLKFEVGKHYRTRDGRRAIVFFIRAGGYMVGEIDGAMRPVVWTAGGSAFSTSLSPHKDDLVAEWREPARVLGILYRNKTTGEVAVTSFAQVEKAWDHRIGTAWLEEGQFAEGGGER